MKRLIALSFLSILPFTSSIASTSENTITLVNHYNANMHFVVRASDVNIVPDFKPTFDLCEQCSVTSRIIPGAPAYIAGKDTDDTSVFFAVESVDNVVNINGYISKGIAFSWDHSVITFCTADDYQKQGHC